MPARKKSSKKLRPARKKKKTSPAKNLWIGQGHLYQPTDETIRKDLQES